MTDLEKNFNDTILDETITPPQIIINVSKDKMNAYLKIKLFSDEQVVDAQVVLDKLQELGINNGIDVLKIKNYCEKKQFYREERIVTGKKPIKGEDGYYKLIFNPEKDLKPKVQSDGSVDYKDLDLVTNVKIGDALCELFHFTEGEEGLDIYGEVAAPTPGKNPTWPMGKNTVLREDEKFILADADGAVDLVKDKIVVEESLTITTDVGPITGNIDYNGSITIIGSVLEGYSVNATKCIIVKGVVEGAIVTAGGDITIGMGFSGMAKGKITAGGNITTKYIDNGTATCGGNFRADFSMNGIIFSKESVIMKGKKSAIINGKVTAAGRIIAKEIGSNSTNHTTLIVDENWFKRDENYISPTILKEKLEHEIAKLKVDINNATANINKVREIDPNILDEAGKKNKIELTQKLFFEKTTLSSTLRAKQNELEKIVVDEKKVQMKIVCQGPIHTGTKIQIVDSAYKVKPDTRNVKFYLDEGEVVLGQILPSDIDYD